MAGHRGIKKLIGDVEELKNYNGPDKAGRIHKLLQMVEEKITSKDNKNDRVKKKAAEELKSELEKMIYAPTANKNITLPTDHNDGYGSVPRRKESTGQDDGYGFVPGRKESTGQDDGYGFVPGRKESTGQDDGYGFVPGRKPPGQTQKSSTAAILNTKASTQYKDIPIVETSCNNTKQPLPANPPFKPPAQSSEYGSMPTSRKPADQYQALPIAPKDNTYTSIPADQVTEQPPGSATTQAGMFQQKEDLSKLSREELDKKIEEGLSKLRLSPK